MNKVTKNIIIFVVVIIATALILSFVNLSSQNIEDIDLQTFINEVKNGEVASITVDGGDVSIEKTDGTLQQTKKERQGTLDELLVNNGVTPETMATIKRTIKEDSGADYWFGLILPFLFPFLIIIALFYFMMRQVQGANSKAMMFGQVQTRDGNKDKKNKTTFSDVAGAKEAKEELKEIVEFLISPKKFTELGAKIPKGVLLMGAPGTGKTLLAKAVAGEADVPFYSISGSEFVEMFVGVGASRVRDLFKKAQKTAPCIVFIDEIDAVGRQRGAGLGGSHDEREQTLNQILVEMDGFDVNSGVIILAATNRPDVLDPALLRPGRFDRQVILDLPDVRDRESIMKVHAENKPMENDVDIREVADRTPGFSGADLANLLNEAAILAARRNKKRISQNEIVESIEKVLLGPERKSHVLDEEEKKITAYHEAAHALVSHVLPKAKTVRKVSIISRGRAAGYTLTLPEKDQKMQPKSAFEAEIAVMLAGHTVETMIFGEPTTGASNDLKKATSLAKQLVTKYGMSDILGPRTYNETEEMIFLGKEIHEQKDYSEKTAQIIDEEIHKIITDGQKKAKELLEKHRDKLEEITNVLLEKETIEKQEFEALFA